eukprot:gb/GECG01008366.1/.p1 GENE.gb/GECG01008366.1/~~gb/GECG01008366.1/.p1  ORF type:complete len:102 (+),score=28.74 gb/GECG01008366.1/:1-306(+)
MSDQKSGKESSGTEKKEGNAPPADDEQLGQYKNVMDDKALDELDHAVEADTHEHHQHAQPPSEVDDFFSGEGGEKTETQETAKEKEKPSQQPEETQEDLLG